MSGTRVAHVRNSYYLMQVTEICASSLPIICQVAPSLVLG